MDHVQARASLGDGFAFHGGTAACDHCVASGSGGSGLSWERGWQGGAARTCTCSTARGGGDGLSGGHDPEGHDREPRSLPTLSNLTLVHAAPYDRRTRRAVAVRLADGTAVQLRDLLAAHFGGGALRASGRSRLLFGEGESTLVGALLWLNGSPQVPAGIAEDAEFEVRNPKLRDVRDFAAPDPRPKADSPRPDDRAQRLHRGLRPERQLAQGVDRVRARVRVRHPAAERGRELAPGRPTSGRQANQLLLADSEAGVPGSAYRLFPRLRSMRRENFTPQVKSRLGRRLSPNHRGTRTLGRAAKCRIQKSGQESPSRSPALGYNRARFMRLPRQAAALIP